MGNACNAKELAGLILDRIEILAVRQTHSLCLGPPLLLIRSLSPSRAFARFLHSHSYFFFIFHPDYLLNRKSKTSISTANATSTTTLASIYELRNKILRACSFDRKLCEKSLGNMRSINRIDRLENNQLKDDRAIVFDTMYLKRNLLDRSKKITVARGDVSRGTRFSRESNAGMKRPSRASTSAADSIERNDPWAVDLLDLADPVDRLDRLDRLGGKQS